MSGIAGESTTVRPFSQRGKGGEDRDPLPPNLSHLFPVSQRFPQKFPSPFGGGKVVPASEKTLLEKTISLSPNARRLGRKPVPFRPSAAKGKEILFSTFRFLVRRSTSLDPP